MSLFMCCIIKVLKRDSNAFFDKDVKICTLYFLIAFKKENAKRGCIFNKINIKNALL